MSSTKLNYFKDCSKWDKATNTRACGNIKR